MGVGALGPPIRYPYLPGFIYTPCQGLSACEYEGAAAGNQLLLRQPTYRHIAHLTSCYDRGPMFCTSGPRNRATKSAQEGSLLLGSQSFLKRFIQAILNRTEDRPFQDHLDRTVQQIFSKRVHGRRIPILKQSFEGGNKSTCGSPWWLRFPRSS